MTYKTVLPGSFLSRPNRFIAQVKINGEICVCHVKNTGRCRELLVPGAEVYVEKSENPARKTLYDLIAVRKGENCHTFLSSKKYMLLYTSIKENPL